MAEISKYEAYVIARIEEMEQDPADYNIERVALIMQGLFYDVEPTGREKEHVNQLIERNMWWGLDDYRDWAYDVLEGYGVLDEVDCDGVADCLMEYMNGLNPAEITEDDFAEIVSDNKRL